MKSLSPLPVWAGLLALALAGCEAGRLSAEAPDIAGERFGQVRFEPCGLSAPMGQPVEARCATVSVPEDHGAPDGRRIDLAVAWVPATGNAAPDPVFLLAGGPGQSALESYPQVHAAFKDVLRNRHVLLVDARGTGGSNRLACRDQEGNNAFTDPSEQTAAAARAFAERCRDQLSEDADLRFYGTGDHIRDLEAVRALLGAPQVDLVGISYGTRVAQQYAARFPERTRTVVLDSVAPNALVVGDKHETNPKKKF
jgi:pimeloyl-ACP methyl ester carboxylesterase